METMMTKTNGKPTNRWLDVQIVIGSLGMAFSLFLWNIFASGSNNTVIQPVTNVQDSINTNVQAIQVPTQAASQSLGTILLGGSTSQVQPAAPFVPPAPVTRTGSSRP
jgi:hypothetical protein